MVERDDKEKLEMALYDIRTISYLLKHAKSNEFPDETVSTLGSFLYECCEITCEMEGGQDAYCEA